MKVLAEVEIYDERQIEVDVDVEDVFQEFWASLNAMRERGDFLPWEIEQHLESVLNWIAAIPDDAIAAFSEANRDLVRMSLRAQAERWDERLRGEAT